MSVHSSDSQNPPPAANSPVTCHGVSWIERVAPVSSATKSRAAPTPAINSSLPAAKGRPERMEGVWPRTSQNTGVTPRTSTVAVVPSVRRRRAFATNCGATSGWPSWPCATPGSEPTSAATSGMKAPPDSLKELPDNTIATSGEPVLPARRFNPAGNVSNTASVMPAMMNPNAISKVWRGRARAEARPVARLLAISRRILISDRPVIRRAYLRDQARRPRECCRDQHRKPHRQAPPSPRRNVHATRQKSDRVRHKCGQQLFESQAQQRTQHHGRQQFQRECAEQRGTRESQHLQQCELRFPLCRRVCQDAYQHRCRAQKDRDHHERQQLLHLAEARPRILFGRVGGGVDGGKIVRERGFDPGRQRFVIARIG